MSDIGDQIERVKELRGKYAGVGPYVDEVTAARLAALREVREMVARRRDFWQRYAEVAERDWHHMNEVESILCLLGVMIAKEETK